MNEHTDSDQQAELAALRQRLSDLEAEHRELQRRVSRSRRPVCSRKFLLSTLPVALLLATGGVLYAVDALSIDKDGNIRLGGAVGINRDAISNQQLVIQPKQGYMPFNVTNPAGDVNWLSVSSDGKVIMNGGNVGIGIASPSAKLDVNGKLNVSDTASLKDTTINGGLTVDGKGNSSFAGNVGIGTQSPKYPLDVRGDFRVVNDDTKLQGFTGRWDAAGSYTTINSYRWSDPPGLQPLRLDGSVLLLNSTGGGNVGIGKDTAVAKLDVNGNQNITGNLTVTGDITVTGRLKFPNDWEVYSGPTNLNFSKKGLKMSINDNERLQYNMPDVPGQKRGFYFLGWGDGNRAEWQSDARFKTDVCTISTALDKVNRLNGITYRWNRTALDYFTADIKHTISAGPGATLEANQKLWQAERVKRYKELSNTNVGVVAQDVEAVLPEAVATDESGYKSVSYYELIPLVIEALKEEDGISKGQSETIARQQAEIQRLTAASQLAAQQLIELREVKQKLARLEAAVSALAASGSSGDHNALVSSAEGSK